MAYGSVVFFTYSAVVGVRLSSIFDGIFFRTIISDIECGGVVCFLIKCTAHRCSNALVTSTRNVCWFYCFGWLLVDWCRRDINQFSIIQMTMHIILYTIKHEFTITWCHSLSICLVSLCVCVNEASFFFRSIVLWSIFGFNYMDDD